MDGWGQSHTYKGAVIGGTETVTDGNSYKLRGRNFKHFKTLVECSRNGMIGNCITSSEVDVRQKLKDRGIKRR